MHRASHKRKGLKDIASSLRHYGEEDDKILAHINPEEAHLLEDEFGMDYNPYTGLPQFGFLKKLGKGIGKVFHGVERNLLRPITHLINPESREEYVARKAAESGQAPAQVHIPSGVKAALNIKPILPFAMGAGASMLGGGPLAAALAGTAGGAMQGKKNMAQNSLMGGLKGFGTGALMHNLLGTGQGGYMDPINKIGNLFGGKGLAGISKGLSGFGGEGGSFDIGGDALDKMLMAAALGGKLFGKEKNKQMTEEERMREEMRKFNRSEHPVRAPKPLSRRAKSGRKQYTLEDIEAGRGYTPEQYFEEANPVTEYYKKGGYVRGGSSGQADDVKTVIPKGSYVMNATDVSLIGDGNTEHGAKKLSELESKLIKSGYNRRYTINNYPKSSNVRVHLSDGEYVLDPHAVNALGGAKSLDRMRKNLRSHKGVKSILPPKTKSLHAYMR